MRATWAAQTDCVAGIVMADGDGIEKRGDRSAGHRPVEAVQRLLPAGHPEGTDTAQERPGDGRETGAPAVHTPAGPSKGTAPKATAASAMNNSDQRGQNARVGAFGDHARPRQAQGPDEAAEAPLRWSFLVGHAPFRVACRMRASGRIGIIPTGEQYRGL
jgi:hypothetical protein